MLDAIIIALKNTPTWVYILLFFLIFMGIKATRPQQIPLKRLFILPIVFTYMSIEMLITHIKINLFSISSWSLAIIIGIIIGWWQIQRLTIQVNKPEKTFLVPGSWSTLVIILLIFGSKYYFGYIIESDPHLLENTQFELTLLMISGICSGFFIGRLCNYLYRLSLA